MVEEQTNTTGYDPKWKTDIENKEHSYYACCQTCFFGAAEDPPVGQLSCISAALMASEDFGQTQMETSVVKRMKSKGSCSEQHHQSIKAVM